MADDEIKLKLVLDVLGAKKEASSAVKAIDGVKEKVGEVAEQMNNTLRGRVVKGLASVVSQELGTIFDAAIPDQLRQFELTVKGLGAAVESATGSRQAGINAQALARQAGGTQAAALQQTTAQLQAAQALLPTVPINQQFVNAAVPVLQQANLAALNNAKDLARNISQALPSQKILIDKQQIARDVLAQAKAGVGLVLDPSIIGLGGGQE